MAAKRGEPEKAARKSKQAVLKGVASHFAGFRHARVALREVRAVPTRFVQLDHATKVNGWPLDRATLIHGRSNEGKSLFSLGLLASFVDAGHMALLEDAERTTPISWARQVMGVAADSDRFFANKPKSYEACVDEVRGFMHGLRDARLAKDLPKEAAAVVVIDSLRKLVPEGIFEKIKKQGAQGDKGSVDGMGGRAAQIRAAMNAAWLDEVVPLMDDIGGSFVMIAREAEDPDADAWARKFGTNYKVGGGKAVYYDASLVVRITRDCWVTDKRGGDSKVYGERHRLEIKKTKVGGKEDRVALAYFHSSNGTQTPFGLDRARDVLDLGQRFGLVHRDEGRLKWPGHPRLLNEHDAALELSRDAAQLADLDGLLRGEFAANRQVEMDEGTGEVT